MSRERFLQLLKYAVITYLGWAGMALFLTTQQRTIGSARGWAAALYTPDVEHFTSMMVWALVTRVEAELADAQLRRLRADLQPHFLFNTLNALATLVHLDPVAARESVGKLIDLLGDSFEARDEKSVALREELAFASRYLDLQKLRFGEKLRTHIDVADEDLLNAAVPRFLLH